MIVNEVTTGIIAIVIAYLLGSFPSAYIAGRLVKGEDIRKLGSGNAGANNVFQEISKVAAVFVGIFDVGKGVGAIALANWLLGEPQLWTLGAPQLWLLGAGLAAITGHIWSIYLKFTGGNGLAATIGVMVMLMPWELLIALAATVVLAVITRNLVLSLNISLLVSFPISGWFLEESWLAVVFPVVISIILIINFIPTARAAMAKAGNREKLTAELLRQDKAPK